MEKLRIHVCATDVHVTQLGRLTTGMVGATASFSFSPEWAGLLKTAVFVGTAASKDVILTESTMEIPPECLARRGSLQVGVYGMLEDGTVVIPSVMSSQCPVDDGAKPSGDTQSGYTRDKWAQMLGMIGDTSHLTTEDKSSLVAAVNEMVQLVRDAKIETLPDDTEQIDMLIEADLLPAVHDASGAILTDENGNVILRY